ncbi:MAG TPA: HEAT repeat domain-containing protein [Spirochaetota bacterium]|nr:HEAT repeat domain-containing protein [Spirochaetota bacterium]HPS85115.1 HEAT repeat domain-containing protein [Spirochaetota bacterium]
MVIILLSVLILVRCSTGNQFTEDAEIQKNITSAVNNYNSDNWETRLESVKSISKYSNTVYAKNTLLLVLKALDDSHSEVRIEVLKILKKMKAPAAEERIGSIALADENSNVRFFAFSALEEYGNIVNEDIFINGLDDADWLVKEAALKGLMKINDPEIQIKYIDIILNAINDRNISIKLTAISNLKIKDPLIYEELARIINDKESGLSVLKAALEQIKGYKLDSITKKRIIELLTHRDKKVRILSLQALKQEELNLNL